MQEYLDWVLDNKSVRLRHLEAREGSIRMLERPLYREIIALVRANKIPYVEEAFDWGFSFLLREPWINEFARSATPHKLAWFLNWGVVRGRKEGAQFMWFGEDLPIAKMGEVPMVWEDERPAYVADATEEEWLEWVR